MIGGENGVDISRELYARIISPFLGELAAFREQLAQATVREIKYLAGAGGVGAVLLLPISGRDQNIWLIPPLLALFLGAAIVYRRQARWQARLVRMALESACAITPGMSYQLENADPSFTRVFEQAGLVGRSTRRTLRFHVTGRYRDANFESLHAVLRSGGGKGRHTIFEGVLAQIEMPRTVPLQIVISPSPGTFTSQTPQLFAHPQLRTLTQVDIKGPLEGRFHVHAACRSEDDAEHVRALLTPEVQAALVDVDKIEGHGGASSTFAQLRAAFIENRLYLALPRQEVKKVGSVELQTPKPYLRAPFYMNRTADLSSAFSAFFDDVVLVFRLIERLR
jgi:hypothetical protein